MIIQNYQIRNVLNVYRRQLIQRETGKVRADSNDIAESGSSIPQVNENVLRVIEKVSAHVLRRITTIDTQLDLNPEMITQARCFYENPNPTRKDNRFVFNVIVGNNIKETRSIAFYSSQQLANRFYESVKPTGIEYQTVNHIKSIPLKV